MLVQRHALKNLIKKSGFTQEEFAEKMGISRTYLLTLLEKLEVNEKYLQKAAEILKVQLNVFAEGTESGQTIGERIREVRTALKLNQEEFAQPLDITQSAISHAEKAGDSVSLELIQKISRTHHINIDWLINGNGKMLSKGAALVVKEPESIHSSLTPINDDKLNMWVIPIKAYGGFLQGYENRVFMNSLEKDSFSLIRGECFKFEIEGYSMVHSTEKEKSFLPGNHIVCTRLNGLDWMRKGKVYLFQCIDGMTLKEFVEIKEDKCVMRAYNKEYDDQLKPVPLKSIKQVYHIEYKLVKPD